MFPNSWGMSDGGKATSPPRKKAQKMLWRLLVLLSVGGHRAYHMMWACMERERDQREGNWFVSPLRNQRKHIPIDECESWTRSKWARSRYLHNVNVATFVYFIFYLYYENFLYSGNLLRKTASSLRANFDCWVIYRQNIEPLLVLN